MTLPEQQRKLILDLKRKYIAFYRRNHDRLLENAWRSEEEKITQQFEEANERGKPFPIPERMYELLHEIDPSGDR